MAPLGGGGVERGGAADSFVRKMKANAANIKGSSTSLTSPLLQLQSAFLFERVRRPFPAFTALTLTEEERSSVVDKSNPVFLSPKVYYFISLQRVCL